MPVINLYEWRIKELLGEEFNLNKIAELIPWLGLDIEDISYEYIKVEYNPNRPDFGSPLGICRALKGLIGKEKGIIKYDSRESNFKIYVDPEVKNVRPYIVGCIIKNLKLDDIIIREIIELQEDLHNGLGRKRKKLAIGIHDLDKIKSPIKYTVVGGDFRFIPLGSHKEMSINEILNSHPMGIEYGSIFYNTNKYPILIDSEENVLSFPPIINSIYTEVTSETRNIFIDLTGLDINTMIDALNVLWTTLVDYGGELYSIEIINDGKIVKTPEIKYDIMTINVYDINRLLGLNLSINEICDALEKTRLGIEGIEGDTLRVLIPPYRIDIIHWIDIVEEVAIGLGFWNIEPTLSTSFTVGKMNTKNKLVDKIIDLLVGMGFQEVINFILTNTDEQFRKMRIEEDKRFIEVKSPKSRLYSIIRTSLIPSLLLNLYRSKEAEYPQKLFEIGKIILYKEKIIEKNLLGIVIADTEVSYTDIKAILDSLMYYLGLNNIHIKSVRHPSFIEGRVGEIYLNNKYVGIIGEIHPEVLENFQINVPVIALEIDLDYILENIKK